MFEFIQTARELPNLLVVKVFLHQQREITVIKPFTVLFELILVIIFAIRITIEVLSTSLVVRSRTSPPH